jgi:mono/diheme cytochrome c family protein
MIAAFLILVALIMAGSLFAQRRAPAGADASDAQLVSLGRGVYAANCASCHGANLEGQPNWQQPNPNGSMPAPPHDTTGHTWHHNDEYLFATTKYGGAATSPVAAPNGMPAFGGTLSDREIWAVLAYIKSTWPPEIQEVQSRGHN